MTNYIVCTIDEQYIQHCAVMLYSLRMHNPNVELAVFIIHNGLQRKQIRKLNIFLKPFIEKIEFIKIDDTLLAGFPVSHHVSLATYFRLFIPEVMPANLDKVLFLDSDIVIRKSIQPFWETDIREHSHAAVDAPKTLEDKKRLGIPLSLKYFNAGVLLINLKFWREKAIFTRGLKFIADNSNKIVWWDQDVLNYLLCEHVLIVDPIWNVQSTFWNEIYSEPTDRYVNENAIADPAVLHFSGSGICKPWHFYCMHPYREEYRQILRQTPWRRVPLEGKPSILRQIKTKLKTYMKE